MKYLRYTASGCKDLGIIISEIVTNTLEKVQMKAVTMTSGTQGKEYEDKLKEINLHSSEERRIRFDMIQVFKIMHNYNDVVRRQFFQTEGEESVRVTRQSSDALNILSTRCRTEVRRNFFTNRVAEKWNKLPENISKEQEI